MWRLPLLRFDVGRMFGSLVGSSEENVRRAIQIAESVAPAVLWIDEIDKAFAGATGSAGSDGGTASRVFGTLLTWLSEKTVPRVRRRHGQQCQPLPPELLRKGRFDEIFYVDLPNEAERREVFRIHLSKRGREPANSTWTQLAKAQRRVQRRRDRRSDHLGAVRRLQRGRRAQYRNHRRGMSCTVPLSKTMSEELTRLRRLVHGRARPASGAIAESRPRSCAAKDRVLDEP